MMPSVNEFYAKKQQTYEKQSDADTDSDNELLHSLTKEKKSPQSDLLLPVYHKYKTNKSQRNNKYLDNNDDDDNDSCSNCVRDKLSEILEDQECVACLLIGCFSLIILVWFVFFSGLFVTARTKFNTCSGKTCQEEICNKVFNNRMVGTLCMDLCYNKVISMPKCGLDLVSNTNTSYEFYSYYKFDSSLFMCPKQVGSVELREGMNFNEFVTLLSNFIQSRLNHSKSVEEIVQRILYFTDINHDLKLNYKEAYTLWSLINTKHGFYMLMYADKPFMLEIKDFCGSFIETEEIVSSLYQSSQKSVLQSVFANTKWSMIKREYRIKIVIGVLEFFLEAAAFNPNDEFGIDSLNLCSSIEDSFGYSFYMEGKLINFDQIYSGRELVDRLSGVRCSSDSDCQLTSQCVTKCVDNKCSHELTRPQLVHFCEFLKEYLVDLTDVIDELASELSQCARLQTFYMSDRVAFDSNEMPLTFEQTQSFMERESYWNKSIEYSIMVANIKRKLWSHAKWTDPPKKKKKT